MSLTQKDRKQNNEEIGRIIRRHRKNLGLSQEQLADEVGYDLHRKLVMDIERAKREASWSQMVALINYLKLSKESLWSITTGQGEND